VNRPPAVTAPSVGELTPEPVQGRVFTGEHTVRSTEASPHGRVRLDALARYLQHVAEDDVADAGLSERLYWLVRRTALLVESYPASGERLRLDTFCSATGPRWAQRTTTVTGADGGLAQATAIWVALDPESGRPTPPPEEFHRVYGPSTGGARVSAGLTHPGPPGEAGLPWPVRAADIDQAGHANNATHWCAVEECLARAEGWLPRRAELEYHRPLLAGTVPALVHRSGDDGLWLWLVEGGERLASAHLR
jgi:acyl-ACP thioesterase